MFTSNLQQEHVWAIEDEKKELASARNGFLGYSAQQTPLVSHLLEGTETFILILLKKGKHTRKYVTPK